MGVDTVPFTPADVADASTTPPQPVIGPVASSEPLIVSVAQPKFSVVPDAIVSALIVGVDVRTGALVVTGMTTESVVAGAPAGSQFAALVHDVFDAPVQVLRPSAVPVAVIVS